jgi:hypothetical protein
MSEYGPTLSERAVRQLGVDVANVFIELAMSKGRWESLAELAADINFNEWKTPPKETDFEYLQDPHVEEAPLPPPREILETWSVPQYQVDAVMRLIAGFAQ